MNALKAKWLARPIWRVKDRKERAAYVDKFPYSFSEEERRHWAKLARLSPKEIEYELAVLRKATRTNPHKENEERAQIRPNTVRPRDILIERHRIEYSRMPLWPYEERVQEGG